MLFFQESVSSQLKFTHAIRLPQKPAILADKYGSCFEYSPVTLFWAMVVEKDHTLAEAANRSGVGGDYNTPQKLGALLRWICHQNR